MAPRIYGLMAEFDDATALVAATERAHEIGYKRMDAYSPFPDRGAASRDGLAAQQAAAHRARRRHRRLPRRVLPSVLGVHDRLSDQRRRTSAQQLAGVHPGHLRVHDSRRCAVGGAGHAGTEWPAHAISSGVQRRTVRAREPQPLLPRHRIQGQASSTSTTRANSWRRSTRASASGRWITDMAAPAEDSM